MLIKKSVTWVVIADGARAHVVRQPGSGKPLESVPGEEFANPSTGMTHDLGTDRPGRVADSNHLGGRHSVEQFDWHRFEKKKFAQSIAEHIERVAETKSFDHLVLVAPPDTLGDIRTKLGKHSAAKITAEIANLTHVPIAELASHLGDAVRINGKS